MEGLGPGDVSGFGSAVSGMPCCRREGWGPESPQEVPLGVDPGPRPKELPPKAPPPLQSPGWGAPGLIPPPPPKQPHLNPIPPLRASLARRGGLQTAFARLPRDIKVYNSRPPACWAWQTPAFDVAPLSPGLPARGGRAGHVSAAGGTRPLCKAFYKVSAVTRRVPDCSLCARDSCKTEGAGGAGGGFPSAPGLAQHLHVNGKPWRAAAGAAHGAGGTLSGRSGAQGREGGGHAASPFQTDLLNPCSGLAASPLRAPRHPRCPSLLLRSPFGGAGTHGFTPGIYKGAS